MSKKKRRFVEVEWVDSGTHGAWYRDDEVEEVRPIRCRSAGYLHRNSKTSVALLQTTNSECQKDGLLVIPRGAVTRITELRAK